MLAWTFAPLVMEFGTCNETGLFAHALTFVPLLCGLCLLHFFLTTVALKVVAKLTELAILMAELLGSPSMPSLFVLA